MIVFTLLSLNHNSFHISSTNTTGSFQWFHLFYLVKLQQRNKQAPPGQGLWMISKIYEKRNNRANGTVVLSTKTQHLQRLWLWFFLLIFSDANYYACFSQRCDRSFMKKKMRKTSSMQVITALKITERSCVPCQFLCTYKHCVQCCRICSWPK